MKVNYSKTELEFSEILNELNKLELYDAVTKLSAAFYKQSQEQYQEGVKMMREIHE